MEVLRVPSRDTCISLFFILLQRGPSARYMHNGNFFIQIPAVHNIATSNSVTLPDCPLSGELDLWGEYEGWKGQEIHLLVSTYLLGILIK